MISENIVPVVLCGGSGSRLWPLSRKSFPKQFLSLNNNYKTSLLQNTIQRTKNFKNIENPILICNEEHRFLVAEQIREINVSPNSIILEPFGKNTAPAITIAALKTLEEGEDKHLLILSSDHQILDEDKFLKAIKAGIEYSSKERLVTFGVMPNSPETGYGYIKAKSPLSSDTLVSSDIECFIEKPTKERAKLFIKDKRFTWNSGIFLFKASVVLNEIEKFSPELIKHCKKSFENQSCDLDFLRINKKYFKKCPEISIDVAVMEKTKKGTVLPLDAGWSDIGSWNTVWEVSEKDPRGNVVKGNVTVRNTDNCYLYSENRLIAAIGLKNLLVIETNDAILVSDKDQDQDVKKIVEELQSKKISQGIEHKKIFRPWGNYETLANSDNWQVKIILVKKGASLSLQKHNYRSEHWVVLRGTAKVEIDNKKLILKENQSTFIPLGSKHRLSNPGEEDLKIIEIQSGKYIGEDDIIRYEDNYGRIK